MLKNISLFFALLLAGGIFFGTLLHTGCKDDYVYKDIPYIYTDTTILVNSAYFENLEFIGGWGYIPSGFKGIFIYHLSPDEFVAFERCCTHDPRIEAARVYYDQSRGILIDSICGSEFSPFNGSPTKSPAEVPLRPYRTEYSEYAGRLRITNY